MRSQSAQSEGIGNTDGLKNILEIASSRHLRNVYRLYIIGAICFFIILTCLLGSDHGLIQGKSGFVFVCGLVFAPLIYIKLASNFKEMKTLREECDRIEYGASGAKRISNVVSVLQIAAGTLVFHTIASLLADLVLHFLPYRNTSHINIVNYFRLFQGVCLALCVANIYAEYYSRRNVQHCNAAVFLKLNLWLSFVLMFVIPYFLIPLAFMKYIEIKSSVFGFQPVMFSIVGMGFCMILNLLGRKYALIIQCISEHAVVLPE